MRCQLILSAPIVVLLLLGACGDDSGLICGNGTEEAGGECVAVVPDAGTSNSPADRRLCDTPFGPVGGSALYVDAAYAGGDSDGSEDRPFADIQSAINIASAGQEIGIASGTYPGDLSIDASISIEGRCANDVVIDGSIAVQDTGGVAIRGITVQNGSPGVLVSNVQPAAGEEYGLKIRFVRATLNEGAGIEINASAVEMLDSEFTLSRGVADGDLRQLGSGVFINDGSLFDLSSSYIGMNGFMAVDIADATGQPLRVEGDTVSKATATGPSTGYVGMNGIIGNEGGGIRVGGAPTGLLPPIGASSVQILGNELSQNAGIAISVASAGVDIVGNSLEGGADSTLGINLRNATGSIANNQIDTFAGGAVDLRNSRGVAISNNTITSNTDFGILSVDNDGISMTGNHVSGTISAPAVPTGHGIFILATGISTVGEHNLTSNTVSDNEGAGIGVDSLDLGDTEARLVTMFNNTVARNALMGIDLRRTRAVGMFGNALIDNVGFGLRCVDGPGAASRVFFDDNLVKGTIASGSGLDGDAILMSNCHVSVDLNEIAENARNGVVLDDGTDGGCDDNQVTGHGIGNPNVHDILLQGSNMVPTGNTGADIQDNTVALNLEQLGRPSDTNP